MNFLAATVNGFRRKNLNPACWFDLHRQKKQGCGWGYLLTLLLHSSVSPVATAQTLPGEINAQELQRQQERERALREQQELTPDVRLQTAVPVEAVRLP
ncbi:MAG: hypothetical protein WBP47_19855, partial [Candidatus Promineifilaceae bacterium]